MNIVILEKDNLGNDMDVTSFDEFGSVTIYPISTQEEAADRIKDADIIVVNKIKVNEQLLKSADKVKLICETATGTDNIDLAYCKGRGIRVTNVKGYSTASVVQHTIASALYIIEKLSYYDNFVKSGQYEKSKIFAHFDERFVELAGKTWGIIGLGEIGRGVAGVAKALGCQIIYYSTSGKNAATDYRQVDFDTMLSEADVISIHAPLNENTRDLINLQALRKMKKTAVLVNMGRGPIVNEIDLYKALSEDMIAGAALDVLSAEPIAAENPLSRLKDSNKIIITPHMAWATVEARTRLVKEVYLNIKAFLNGEERSLVS